jgi:hypothetical protein
VARADFVVSIDRELGLSAFSLDHDGSSILTWLSLCMVCVWPAYALTSFSKIERNKLIKDETPNDMCCTGIEA